MNKKITTVLLSSVLAVSLVGCGTKAPKQAYIDSLNATNNATSYTADITLHVKDIKADPTSMGMDANQYNDMVTAIKGSNIEFKELLDKKNKKAEVIVTLNATYQGVSVNAELPVYIDGNTNKMYVSVDKLPAMLGIPASLKGKVIEVDLNQLSKQDPTFDASSINSLFDANASKKQNDQMVKIITALDDKLFTNVDLSSDDKSKGVGQVVEMKLDDATVKNIIKTLVDSQNDPSVKNFDQQWNDISKQFTVSVDSTTGLDSNSVAVYSDITATVTANGSTPSEKGSLTINAHETVSDFNKAQQFTIDPSKDQVITMQDAEQAMQGQSPMMLPTQQ